MTYNSCFHYPVFMLGECSLWWTSVLVRHHNNAGIVVKRELSQKAKLWIYIQYIHSNLHLWLWALGSNCKHEIRDTSGINEFSFMEWLSQLRMIGASDWATPPWGFSMHNQLEDLGADPELGGGNSYLIWPKNVLGFTKSAGKHCLGGWTYNRWFSS